jgi:hypothetical protein
MYDLDAIEKAAFAFLHTDRTSATWPQVEDDFQKIAADPHVILYLVKAVKALGDGQAAGRETKMLRTWYTTLPTMSETALIPHKTRPVFTC